MEKQDTKVEGYIYPKDFFQKNKPAIRNGLCFVMMPFDPSTDEVYEVVRRSLAECGITAVRADQVFDTKPIMISIMEKINESELIIADVTGRNPNVFYELGMAHVLKESVLLVTSNIEDVPFDLRHFRYITYENSMDGASKLRQSLLDTLFAIGLNRQHAPEGAIEAHEQTDLAPVVLEPLSTTISFQRDLKFNNTKEKMFALLMKWVDYEQVQDRLVSLAFPGGTFSQTEGRLRLTVQPHTVPLPEVVAGFGHVYESIGFGWDRQLDLGDLIRRSRGGSRKVTGVSKDRVTIGCGEDAELVVENKAEGCGLTVRLTDVPWFQDKKNPVTFPAVLNYLQEEPPCMDLLVAIIASRRALP